MIRIGLVGDSHFDERNRFEECRAIHHWMAEDMRARGVHLVLHSGDMSEAREHERNERAARAEAGGAS